MESSAMESSAMESSAVESSATRLDWASAEGAMRARKKTAAKKEGKTPLRPEDNSCPREQKGQGRTDLQHRERRGLTAKRFLEKGG
jgi:hypothetical protein